MIFHPAAVLTGEQNGQKANPIGNAARRQLTALLSELYAAQTRKWLGRQIASEPEARGLQLASSPGEALDLIAFPMPGSGVLPGSAVLPRLTGSASTTPYPEGSRADLCDWTVDRPVDFIYLRIWSGSLAALLAGLPAIGRNLRDGGRLLLEVVSLSGYHSYPYYHALARSMELIGRLEPIRPGARSLPEPAERRLRAAGFGSWETAVSLPVFVSGPHRGCASLALETCRVAILHETGTTTEELNALMVELKYLEQQDDTLINRPGLLQLAARYDRPPQVTHDFMPPAL